MDVVLQYILGWQLPAILCLVAGLILLIYEMFLPGMHFPGILGMVLLLAAVVLRAKTWTEGLITFLIVLLILGVFAVLFWRSLTKGRLSRSPVVLNESISGGSSERADAAIQALVGREGVCLTALRPAGNAEFDGVRHDVVSDGAFLQKGTRVRVVRVEGVRILVNEAE